jgi:hypothetical protein
VRRLGAHAESLADLRPRPAIGESVVYGRAFERSGKSSQADGGGESRIRILGFRKLDHVINLC